MHTIELADIRIRAALPLHPYLSEHSHVFLRLLADESVCGDTAGVDGDLATGVWGFNARLYAPRVNQSLNVGVLTGVKGPGTQLVSVTLKVGELLARETACPNRHQYIVIFDSRGARQLKLVMTCSIKLSSILGRVSQAAGDKGQWVSNLVQLLLNLLPDHTDNTINRRSRNNEFNFDPERMHLSSREDLESSYVKANLMPDHDNNKARRLSLLGYGFHVLYQKEHGMADLAKTISIYEEAMQITRLFHPHMAVYMGRFAMALLERFQQTGDGIDIERAISCSQIALRFTEDLGAAKPSQLSTLGNALQLRFQRFGGLVDLENSILCQRETIKLIPDHHPNMPGLFNNLGCALRYRFERLGDIADLEDSISNLRQAIQLAPNGHPGSPMWFNNLGLALLSRFLRLDGLADLEDAISNLGKAVPLVPDGHPEKPILFNNLGTALRSRFERLGHLADIDEAISNQRQAVQLMPDGYLDKPVRLYNLAIALESRFKRLGDLSDLETALSAFSTAANSILGSAMVRFKAARTWARVSEEHSRSPLDACQCAINLLPRIAWLGLALTDQHALLADVGRVVPDAVAAAIRYGEYETAVIWAEQGRSIVWQNLLGLRSPVDNLHETHPELAGRLRGIAKQLEGSGSRLEAPKASSGDFSVNYSKLAMEWDNIVEEVRRIPRFEGFLKAKSFRQLAPAAHEGPVVILNINGAQCDALVLISDDSVERKVSALHIPLERFSHEKSKKMFQTLTELLSSAGVRERTDRKTGRSRSQVDGEAKFKVILGILWTDVVKPVIEALAFQVKPQRPPRIWWCVTGLLTFLPIHAAGLYDTQETGQKISDYVVSSYTPTLTAILEPSDPTGQDNFQVLTVAQASAPGAPPIPKTEDEVRIIQGLVTRARVLNLTGKNATVGRVREGMVESNWIHLACHGQQNRDNPMESGFLLHDKVLKLSEIVKIDAAQDGLCIPFSLPDSDGGREGRRGICASSGWDAPIGMSRSYCHDLVHSRRRRSEDRRGRL